MANSFRNLTLAHEMIAFRWLWNNTDRVENSYSLDNFRLLCIWPLPSFVLDNANYMASAAIYLQFGNKTLFVKYHHGRLIKRVKLTSQHAQAVPHFNYSRRLILACGTRENAPFLDMVLGQDLSLGFNSSFSTNTRLGIFAHALEENCAVFFK